MRWKCEICGKVILSSNYEQQEFNVGLHLDKHRREEEKRKDEKEKDK